MKHPSTTVDVCTYIATNQNFVSNYILYNLNIFYILMCYNMIYT